MSGWSVLIVLSVAVAQLCSGECPGGWVSHEGSCYIYFHEKYSYFEAKLACDIARSRLVEITTDSENEFIKNLVQAHGAMYGWTGLEDFIVEGEFHWTTSNDRPTFTKWQRGAPNDALHAEDCVAIHGTDGTWNDIACTSRLSFTCEQPSSSVEAIG